MNFKELSGKLVSILITGKSGYKETYLGKLEYIDEEWIKIIPDNPKPDYPIEEIYVRVKILESVWIINER